ncbi:MAG: hypothetical protein O2854_10070 [Chloroflexi bacterium]|nr:hypothetical protein [Chloroflexota bacterium]
MRLIIVGVEYVGKTTLAEEIIAWTGRMMGGGRTFHDHFTIPNPELAPEAREEFLKVSPQIKEMYQRFMMAHHLSPSFYRGPDHNMTGFHIEEAVYAPLYYGYGGKQNQSGWRSPEGQRTQWAREIEKEVLEIAPDTVLVHMKATPDVIRKRKNENPHQYNVIEDKDIEFLLERFEQEVSWSLIHRRIVLDTSKATVQETLAEFEEKIEPLLSEADRLRILTHQVLGKKG